MQDPDWNGEKKMAVEDTLAKITQDGASDIFIVAGLPLSYKKKGQFIEESSEKLMPADTAVLITEIYELAGGRDMSRLQKYGDDDFSFALRGVARFRINAYKQRGSLSAVIRVITFRIPDPALQVLCGQKEGNGSCYRTRRKRKINNARMYDRPYQFDKACTYHHA